MTNEALEAIALDIAMALQAKTKGKPLDASGWWWAAKRWQFNAAEEIVPSLRAVREQVIKECLHTIEHYMEGCNDEDAGQHAKSALSWVKREIERQLEKR